MLSDVVVVYDELAGHFALGVLDFNFSNRTRFDFAVSVDSNPLDGFTLVRYDMNDGVGGVDINGGTNSWFSQAGFLRNQSRGALPFSSTSLRPSG